MLAEAVADGGADVEVVGENGSPASAVAENPGADVLLVVGEDMLEEAAELVADSDEALLLLSDDPPVPWPGALTRRGWGVISPDAPPEELAAAVTATANGLVVLARSLADQLPLEGGAGSPDTLEPLTVREAEVLELLSRGLPNKQIARELGISEHTVKFHVSSLYGKLRVNSRAEAVGTGARLGLITL